MAQLADQIKLALDEDRTMMLGVQVLLGFEYDAIFQQGFDQLPALAQLLKLTSLGLMLISVSLLLVPASYHQLVERGECSLALRHFITKAMGLAGVPFAVALGFDLYVAAVKLHLDGLDVGLGLAGTLLALVFWYGLALWHQPHHAAARSAGEKEQARMEQQEETPGTGGTPIKDKVEQVLTETRVVLPGVQALLGFQFIAMLTAAFDKLPASSQGLHLASLGCIALSMVLLMTPAAYHRIAERGEDTAHFHRFASRLLLASLVPLTLGLAGDFFVVVRKVTGSLAWAGAAGVLTLVLFYGLLFGFTLYRRSRPAGLPAEVRAARSEG